jgi:FkbM family methyltransferase
VTDLALRFVRRLAGAPGFRHLTRSQALLRLSFALRASLVRERLRFAASELRRRPTTGVYRLRESDVAIALRHHTGDVMVLDEIFSQREYDPPAALAAALARLPSDVHIVDLGANIGLFGAWALGRFPEATVLAVEADPANAAVHRLAIQANDAAERWRLVEAFAATTAGTVRFAAGQHATSHAASEQDAALDVPSIDVFTELGRAGLLKIDVEGAEWELLADPRFATAAPPVVVLEYHREGASGPDPEAEAEAALGAAGLEVVHAGRKPQFGAGLVWAFRP